MAEQVVVIGAELVGDGCEHGVRGGTVVARREQDLVGRRDEVLFGAAAYCPWRALVHQPCLSQDREVMRDAALVRGEPVAELTDRWALRSRCAQELVSRGVGQRAHLRGA